MVREADRISKRIIEKEADEATVERIIEKPQHHYNQPEGTIRGE